MVNEANITKSFQKGHVQTTYFIKDVTKEHLGNYNVQVINWAIFGEPNEVTFNVVLELRGEKVKPCECFLVGNFIFICPFTGQNYMTTITACFCW